jgi:hypothetical protein
VGTATSAFLKAPQKLEATTIKECVFQHPKSTRICSEFEDLNAKTLFNANKYFTPYRHATHMYTLPPNWDMIYIKVWKQARREVRQHWFIDR